MVKIVKYDNPDHPQLHDNPLILVEVLVGLSCFVPVLEKYCIPVGFTVSQDANFMHRKSISCYQVAWSRCFGHKRENWVQNTLLESVK